MAGRVFRISPSTDGSNATHHTSPRLGQLAGLIRDIPDKSLAPFQRLALSLLIRRHGPIARLKILIGDMWAREVIEEPADTAPAYVAVQPLIDIIIHRDRQLLRHCSAPIRRLHV